MKKVRFTGLNHLIMAFTPVDWEYSDDIVKAIARLIADFDARMQSKAGKKITALYLKDFKNAVAGMPDIVILLDRIAAYAGMCVSASIVHELCHDYGMNEIKARAATNKFVRVLFEALSHGS